jgi:hypothetical protein
LTGPERDELERLTNEAALSKQIDQLGSALTNTPDGSPASGLASAVKAAWFDPTTSPSVKLRTSDVGIYAGITPPSPATGASPRRLEGVYEVGVDRRYLFQHLPTVDIGDDLRVDALVETSRSLPSPLSTAVLSPTGTSTKPEVSSTVTLELRYEDGGRPFGEDPERDLRFAGVRNARELDLVQRVLRRVR